MKKLRLIPLICLLAACGSHPATEKGEAAGKDTAKVADAAPANDADSANAGTPVTVTTVSNSPLNDSIELNAVSAFLQKSYVKANANGYLQSNNAYPGQYVEAGQTLFTLKTKEAQSIGNAIRQLDSTLQFSGVNTIRAGQHGYITQLDHQSGDYVQDGEQLAVISDRNSFVFLLNLPYELRPAVLGKKTVSLILPDGVRLAGTIGAVMPHRQSTHFANVKTQSPVSAESRTADRRNGGQFLGHEDDRQHHGCQGARQDRSRNLGQGRSAVAGICPRR